MPTDNHLNYSPEEIMKIETIANLANAEARVRQVSAALQNRFLVPHDEIVLVHPDAIAMKNRTS